MLFVLYSPFVVTTALVLSTNISTTLVLYSISTLFFASSLLSVSITDDEELVIGKTRS
jgi:hypothetical protein